MNIRTIIAKKKKGLVLSDAEMHYVVRAFTAGEIPDYQMAALLMAICFQSMSEHETAVLTQAMVDSGDRVDLSSIPGVKVDKHSTGGVGDKISLIVMPVMAALGVTVAKLSGRGLGHTGGTIDKLESIPGFHVEMSSEDFLKQVREHGIAVVGQSGNLTPADKKIYALRDVTETVDSIPLIASSIMSKKIASGSDAIVLDVKVGSGAFMKTPEEAHLLAEAMVGIGRRLGRRTVAVITSMDQPLGHEVGNFLEVEAAIEVLKGRGAQDEVEVAVEIAAYMALLGGADGSIEVLRERVREILSKGLALPYLKTWIAAQGGDPGVVDAPERYRYPHATYYVRSDFDGYVSSMNAEAIGRAAQLLGAGRAYKEEPIDYAAGVLLCKKIGDSVTIGETIFELHTNRDPSDAITLLKSAYRVTSARPATPRAIYEVIE